LFRRTLIFRNGCDRNTVAITSLRPDSFDWYAIHRPSGENAGQVSAASVLRNGVGLPGFHPDASSPSIGNIIRSKFVAPESSTKIRNFPDGCHEP